MTTTDTILVIILTSLLSLFFILCIVATVIVIKLLNSIRQVVAKADEVVDSVESAAEIFKQTQGRLAIFKLIRNIIKMTQKGSKK